MAAKRFSGKWTVSQTIIKEHFTVSAYKCVLGLQNNLQSWQVFFCFSFFTLAPVNLIFICSSSISFFWHRNIVNDPSFIRYFIYLNLPSHSINKLKNRSRSHEVMCCFLDMQWLGKIWHSKILPQHAWKTHLFCFFFFFSCNFCVSHYSTDMLTCNMFAVKEFPIMRIWRDFFGSNWHKSAPLFASLW